jgi:hypothetical protein
MNPVNRLQRAWRLYQTDSRVDTIIAVVLIAVVAYPFVQVWVRMRRAGRR